MASRTVLLLAGAACLAGVILPEGGWHLPGQGASHLYAVEEPRWDRDAAARYLDSRMDVWWENAKTLKTNGGDTRCLSCHTALPYVWARQALRRSREVAQPTSHELRVVEQISRRIGYRGDDQPYYDHTEAKKIESRGVEAVINAVALTGLDDDSTSGERQPLVASAVSRMWNVQRPDGAWDWLDFGLEPYEAPDAVFQGATLAALAAGSLAARKAGDNEMA